LEKEKKALVNKETSSRTLSPANKELSPANNESSPANNKDSSPITPSSPSYLLESFLSKILASPDAMKNPSFFTVDKNKLESMFLQTCNETCELERRKQKEKKQEAVSVAVQLQIFDEKVEPKEYPTLFSKNIGLTSNEDITPVLREIVKLSRKVKSVDLLKVLHYNDATTSLVEVPCSAKMSGFKQQARRSRWVHRVLQCVR
jgi:hypothetical protein